jgi:transposase InsO family protein
VTELVALDCFTVPPVGCTVLFVLVVLAHARRRVVQFHVTESPTAQWTAPPLVEAFPWGTAPKSLLRDRDAVDGEGVPRRIRRSGMDQILAAPRSPWQHAYVERVIGSLRRECLDHVLSVSDNPLRRLLASYFQYSHRWRTHLSLAMHLPQIGRNSCLASIAGLCRIDVLRGDRREDERGSSVTSSRCGAGRRRPSAVSTIPKGPYRPSCMPRHSSG